MAWILLVGAGLLEVVWSYAMKQSRGFTSVVPTTVFGLAAITSMIMLSWSMRTLPLGTAYAVWTGLGAVGAFILGVIALGEAATPLRIVAALLLGAGPCADRRYHARHEVRRPLPADLSGQHRSSRGRRA